MTRQVVSSGGPFEPLYGYSRAVRVGVQVHVAGTAARGEALAGDAYAQTQNILATIRSALEQAGARIEDVVRTVIYVTDIGDADLVGRAHSEVFGSVRPASTMVQYLSRGSAQHKPRERCRRRSSDQTKPTTA